MKKKGFTLIELLAVIVVLAIILSIAVPAISSLINNARENAVVTNEKIMLKAAKNYIAFNNNAGLSNIGDTVELTVSQLQTSQYLSQMADPYNKGNACGGYVLVTKISNTDFDYTTHIKCSDANTISDSTNDGLLGHYKFDDYQEPTTNLLFDNGVINWTISNLGTTVTRTTLIPNERYLIRSGASDGTFRFYVPLSKLTNGKTYNLSYKYKIISGTVFNMNDWNDQPLSNVVNTNYGDYMYSSACGTYSGYSDTFRFMDFNISGNAQIEIWDVQLEEKDHATTFTNASRTGVVTDYSFNSNNATLNLATTPKWVSGKSGSGAYEFNGISNVISTSNVSFGNNLSVCLWAKPYTSAVKEMVIHGTVGNGGFELFQSNVGISLRGGSGGSIFGNDALTINGWRYVCGTINGTTGKVYSDGKLLNTGTVAAPKTASLPINIGAYGDLQYSFSGVIDDVRIYNRTLSDQEIKLLYITELSK